MAEQWMSIVEYARKFAISDMTIRRRIKTGRLHAVLKDGKYYIPVANEQSASQQRHNQMEARLRNDFEPYSQAQDEAPPQQTREMVKHHPAPQRTVVARPQVPARETYVQQPKNQFSAPEPGVSAGLIPTSMRMGLEESPISSVETKALLDFCDSVLRRFSKLEQRVEDSYKAKFSVVEQQLAIKDQEINKLRQQIEDLQLLVKVLERKGP